MVYFNNYLLPILFNLLLMIKIYFNKFYYQNVLNQCWEFWQSGSTQLKIVEKDPLCAIIFLEFFLK